MKKLLILLATTLLLSSCFGGDDVSVEVPQVENTIQEEAVDSTEARNTNSLEVEINGENEEETVSDITDTETSTSTTREALPIEKVDIKEAGTDNPDYDIRSNIESDVDASVVTEETFVLPTAPTAAEIQVEEVEPSVENDALVDDVLLELLGDIDDSLEIIEENE